MIKTIGVTRYEQLELWVKADMLGIAEEDFQLFPEEYALQLYPRLTPKERSSNLMQLAYKILRDTIYHANTDVTAQARLVVFASHFSDYENKYSMIETDLHHLAKERTMATNEMDKAYSMLVHLPALEEQTSALMPDVRKRAIFGIRLTLFALIAQHEIDNPMYMQGAKQYTSSYTVVFRKNDFTTLTGPLNLTFCKGREDSKAAVMHEFLYHINVGHVLL